MAMKRYTPDELQAVLDDHKKWLANDGGQRADLQGADLRGAYLRGADLQDAYLQGAYLQGADLRGADLQGAYLQDAYLQGADLRGAYLRGADLQAADLQGADLQGVKIKSTAVFTGLYHYVAMPVISEDGTEYVRLGCHFRKVSEWEENFWNNVREFPDDGSTKSQERLMAYQTCLKWLEIHRAAKSEAA